MIHFGRRGAGVLLTGLAAGAVLVGSLVLAAPVMALPAAVQSALGAPAEVPVPTEAAVSRPVPEVPTVPEPPEATVPPPADAAGPTVPAPAESPAVPPTRAPEPPPVEVTPSAEPPEPEPAEEPEPRTAPSATSLVAGVVAATNVERAAGGCPDLDTDLRLIAAAQAHSENMADAGVLSHTGSDGSGFDDRILAQGHPSPGAENIAQGPQDAAEVVEAWMGSPEHRANILDCSLTTVGVGFDERGNFWTQDFGR